MRSLGGAVAVAVERHCYRLEIFVSREAVMLIVVVVIVYIFANGLRLSRKKN